MPSSADSARVRRRFVLRAARHLLFSTSARQGGTDATGVRPSASHEVGRSRGRLQQSSTTETPWPDVPPAGRHRWEQPSRPRGDARLGWRREAATVGCPLCFWWLMTGPCVLWCTELTLGCGVGRFEQLPRSVALVGCVMVCVRSLRTQQRVKNRCQLTSSRGWWRADLCGWWAVVLG